MNELINTLSRNLLHLEPFAPVIAPKEQPTKAEEKTHDPLSLKSSKHHFQLPVKFAISSEIDNNNKLLLMGRTIFNPLLLISALLLLMHTPKSELVPNPNPRTLAPFHPLCISQFALANHACASISYGPVPHPSSVQNGSTIFDKLSHGRHHSEGHKHRHRRHRHNHHRDAAEEAAKECCRWMKDIDDFCICDILVRLPSFLSRPIHRFVAVIDDDCKVEYKCPGRLMTTP